MLKIGFGYDVHPFTENRALVLGGVQIPWTKGLFGHSDADVLVHAVCDALLGALGEGDIGQKFPDSDPAYKGIPSTNLLQQVVALMKQRGYRVANIDTLIILEQPTLSSYYSQMKAVLSPILGIQQGQLNIKATTTEKLGFEGRGEGVAAQAVVLLERE